MQDLRALLPRDSIRKRREGLRDQRWSRGLLAPSRLDQDGNLSHLPGVGYIDNVWIGRKVVVDSGAHNLSKGCAHSVTIVRQREVSVHNDVRPIVTIRRPGEFDGSARKFNDVSRR